MPGLDLVEEEEVLEGLLLITNNNLGVSYQLLDKIITLVPTVLRVGTSQQWYILFVVGFRSLKS